jgi:hypothetical protein
MTIKKFYRGAVMKKEGKKTLTPARRSFMKLGGCSLLSLVTLGGARKAFGYAAPPPDLTEPGVTGTIARYWAADGLTPVQRTVKNVDLSANTITAKVDGLWKKFKIKELDSDFQYFQSTSLEAIYEKLLSENALTFGGVYCPAIISHGGIKRGDSLFKLNGAYKFVFPVPKEEYITEISDKLMTAEFLADKVARRTYMKEKWADQTVWDYRIQVGRDETVRAPNDQLKRRDADKIYPETHSFRNLMENPLAVVLYLANDSFTSYEVRTICHYAAPPADFETVPESYEDKISRWVNVLGYSSHQVNHKFPGMIFYAVESFDNSMVAGTGEGTRVVQLKSRIQNMYAQAKDRLIG